MFDQKSYPLPSSAQLIKIRRPFWSSPYSTGKRILNCHRQVIAEQTFCREWRLAEGTAQLVQYAFLLENPRKKVIRTIQRSNASVQ
jgi:hypothetical protein